MSLTRDFKDTIRDRGQRDPKFGRELLREGLEALAKTILRDYIYATVGFAGVSQATHIPPKSLMRMFSLAGNSRRVFLIAGNWRQDPIHHRETIACHGNRPATDALQTPNS